MELETTGTIPTGLLHFEQGKLNGLPANAELVHANFDVTELQSIPADENTIVRIITICACDVAQRHEHPQFVLTRNHAVFDPQGAKIPLVEYTIVARMPLTVLVPDTAIFALRGVNWERVRSVCQYNEEGYSHLKIMVDSNNNPGDIESFKMTEVVLRRARPTTQCIVREETAEEGKSVSLKRQRRSSSGASSTTKTSSS